MRRRWRIQWVSRCLMILSLVAMAYQGAWALSTFFLPVISKGPRYDHWNLASESTPQERPRQFSSPRVFVELSGVGPAYKNFAWDASQGGTGILPGREIIARMAACLYVAYGALGAWFFYRLFQAYLRGYVFHRVSVRCLRNIGVWLMGNWVIFLAFNLTRRWWEANPSFSLVVGYGSGLFAGLFIVLVAWIMEEARLMAEEQALTV